MPRLAFKPDASFFRKIAIGAVGARAVCADLDQYGHQMVELERGSTDTKLWKDVKRKRVRIPDLVCTHCGLRVESRAKTDAALSMSHSPTEDTRAWDFGLVDEDYIAFPVCTAVDEDYWSAGRLGSGISYWHERNWVRWHSRRWINYFTTDAFRAAHPEKSSTKGVTEGSETSLVWGATFSSRIGTVTAVNGQTVTIQRDSDGHRHTWKIPIDKQIWVSPGEKVCNNQLIASAVRPVTTDRLTCPGVLPPDHLMHLLASRERTQRFTGVKLARLRSDRYVEEQIQGIVNDREEDIYIRLEGVSYLCAICGRSSDNLFLPYLESTDPQTQLEAVIALGETATTDAITVLDGILDANDKPYFIRSAAAWSLGRIGEPDAARRLVRAFGDVDPDIREEALEAIVSIGGTAIPILLLGLRNADSDIAAGCAEALRQQQQLLLPVLDKVTEQLYTEQPSPWLVWLVGQLPREHVGTAIAELQETSPKLHYAISILWSFIESWISRHWDVAHQPMLSAYGVNDAR